MTPSRQWEAFKKVRKGTELPRLEGPTLALAIRCGSWACQNQGKRATFVALTPESARAVKAWLKHYYRRSCARIDVVVPDGKIRGQRPHFVELPS